MRIIVTFLILTTLLLPACLCAQQSPLGLALPNTSAVEDVMSPLQPSQIQPGGVVGERYRLSEENRLLKIDEKVLLGGFQHRPGTHPWIGEHVGKWLHAASLTWASTGDVALKEKMDRVASELMRSQGEDGYLGTYPYGKRFKLNDEDDWDVWVHKYDLIGLLTYYQYTGNRDALKACERIGSLLLRTFGPGRKSIVSCGTMVGMAPTSILEPMMLLYRATGDERYLHFGEYIVSSWEEENGPHLLSALLKGTPVNKIANGKAYEMTSCMVGLCELYRVTGDRKYLTAVMNGWKDIAANRLYITGSGSTVELWRGDNVLPNDQASSLCETCVSVTWMQLNAELLRLTGEGRFADELERTLFNHLLAAQKPSGDDWCYFTPLEGQKHFLPDMLCCHSSGPRALAFVPTFFYTSQRDGIAVNLFSASKAEIPFDGGKVMLRQETRYPFDGTVRITVTPLDIEKTFSLRLRVPAWAHGVSVFVNGRERSATQRLNGYLALRRRWKAGDVIEYRIDMTSRIIKGDHGNAGLAAAMYGPLVLAADLSHNPKSASIDELSLSTKSKLTVAGEEGHPIFEILRDSGKQSAQKLTLVPFYEAGADGSPFRVWIKASE